MLVAATELTGPAALIGWVAFFLMLASGGVHALREHRRAVRAAARNDRRRRLGLPPL